MYVRLSLYIDFLALAFIQLTDSFVNSNSPNDVSHLNPISLSKLAFNSTIEYGKVDVCSVALIFIFLNKFLYNFLSTL